MKRMTKIMAWLLVAALCMAAGCANNDLAKQRAKNAGKSANILVGVPVPLQFAQKNTKFLKGLELAREDINARGINGRGINGKKIKLQIADDKGNFKTAVDIAQQFTKNTSMVAVIGHWYSDICLPVSNIYEEAGMLNIVPTVSNPEVTEKGYKYVFQSITSDKKIAKEMCSYARSKSFKKVVISYEESSYGENLAKALETEAKAQGLEIVDRCAGLVTEEQFKKSHDKWEALDFDAVLMALNMPEGANYIKELRKIDKQAGIISADGLDVSNFMKDLGRDAEGVVIATTYNPYEHKPRLDEFTARYQAKYHEEPDVWAVQGYESLQIIARAIEQTRSCSPDVLADYLRKMNPWSSVSGQISFNRYGEIEGREVYKKIVVDGKFEYLK